MKRALFIPFLLGILPAVACAQWGGGNYIGDTRIDAGNPDVTVIPTRTTIPMVGIQNHSGKPATCRATFSDGPRFSTTRQATVMPGRMATLGYPIHHVTTWVDIDVKCS